MIGSDLFFILDSSLELTIHLFGFFPQEREFLQAPSFSLSTSQNYSLMYFLFT